MITPTVAGNVRAVVVLNANKPFYVTKSDGTMLDPANGEYKLLQPNGDEIAFNSDGETTVCWENLEQNGVGRSPSTFHPYKIAD